MKKLNKQTITYSHRDVVTMRLDNSS